MSRRERRRPASPRPELGQDAQPRPPAQGDQVRRPQTREAQLRPPSPARARRPGAPTSARSWSVFTALLPLRFFAGATFLYAGIDKLIDPRFLQATGPGSIGEQLTGFTHGSPLGGLVSLFALPFPVAIGVLMALAEIAIGLGALTGLLYRASAAAGAAVSILFWLTASWSVHPYYFGPDLPYAAGWLTLALAGHGGLAVLRLPFAGFGLSEGDPDEASPERRALLQGGLLAAASVAMAGVAGIGGGLFRGTDKVAQVPGASPSAGAGNPGASAAAPSPGRTAAPAAGQIASLTSLKPRSALPFVDPISGDPGILVRLADGKVVAFDAVCTHAGCTVEYDPPSGLLGCPCHGAVFDPTHNADVLQGPAPIALPALPIVVNNATGAITLRG